MNGAVLEFLRTRVSRDEVVGKKVLEVGSYDVNGSPRSILVPHGPAQYLGVDISKGPGVDMVCRASDLVKTFGPGTFDVVVSTEMLEHLFEWKEPLENMAGVLATGGILLVTTRSPGFQYHGYPDDHWRFTADDFRMIFLNMSIEALEPDSQSPGIFIRARKPNGFSGLNLSVVEVAKAPPNPAAAKVAVNTSSKPPMKVLPRHNPRVRRGSKK